MKLAALAIASLLSITPSLAQEQPINEDFFRGFNYGGRVTGLRMGTLDGIYHLCGERSVADINKGMYLKEFIDTPTGDTAADERLADFWVDFVDGYKEAYHRRLTEAKDCQASDAVTI